MAMLLVRIKKKKKDYGRKIKKIEGKKRKDHRQGDNIKGSQRQKRALKGGTKYAFQSKALPTTNCMKKEKKSTVDCGERGKKRGKGKRESQLPQ